jgi:opacity protein-like surface antigen
VRAFPASATGHRQAGSQDMRQGMAQSEKESNHRQLKLTVSKLQIYQEEMKRMSWKKVALWGVAFVVTGSMAMAQEKKVEVGVNFGYTLSEGVNIDPTMTSIGTVNKINPTNAMSWGLHFDYLASENFAIGFLWDQQKNKLNADVQNGSKFDISDNTTYNYHGVFTYNLGTEDSKIRPYFFGGLGATHFSGGNLLLETIPPPTATKVGSETQFSTTWGGGVKFFPSKSVGLKFDLRWTPTYIKSDAEGIWCGGYYWGCWVVGDSDYSNQLKMSAGIIFRF